MNYYFSNCSSFSGFSLLWVCLSILVKKTSYHCSHLPSNLGLRGSLRFIDLYSEPKHRFLMCGDILLKHHNTLLLTYHITVRKEKKYETQQNTTLYRSVCSQFLSIKLYRSAMYFSSVQSSHQKIFAISIYTLNWLQD